MKSTYHRDYTRRVVEAELLAVAEGRLDDRMFVAAITAAACVARADGWVDHTERARLVAWLGDTNLLDGFSPREAEESFDLRVRQFEEPDGIAHAVSSLRRVAGHPRARLIVACAQQVACADGEVLPSEDQVMALIRRAISPSRHANHA